MEISYFEYQNICLLIRRIGHFAGRDVCVPALLVCSNSLKTKFV
jgi:hypothetical protein